MADISADEYVQILNLYARYNLCSDAGDADGYADCFASDGELRAHSLLVRGRDELVAYKRQEVAAREGRYRRHVNGSLLLEGFGEDTVRGRCYLQAFNGVPGAVPELADTGVYDDQIVRVTENWRFLIRTLTMD